VPSVLSTEHNYVRERQTVAEVGWYSSGDSNELQLILQLIIINVSHNGAKREEQLRQQWPWPSW
jgi:hypothetical protein